MGNFNSTSTPGIGRVSLVPILTFEVADGERLNGNFTRKE
jgi:hypothetical protein